MKYKVLKTCHAGGRMCREGTIVEFKTEVDNKYLEPVAKKTPVPPKREGQTLKDLGKREEPTTGMAAKRRGRPKKETINVEPEPLVGAQVGKVK
jgi:hypothetical protein